jgi:hypothetical protein
LQGFCPVQDYEEEESKGATDFKSSEEETGLGTVALIIFSQKHWIRLVM